MNNEELFNDLDKFKMMAVDDKNHSYLSRLMDYIEDKERYDKDVLLKKKIRRKCPEPPNINEFKQQTKVWFAMKEVELMGMNITPMFEEYEQVRCLKCNTDNFLMEQHYLDGTSAKDQIFMGILKKVTSSSSKSGNRYYRLSILDEYMTKEMFCWSKQYEEFQSQLIKDKQLIIRCDIKAGSASLNYCKLLEDLNLNDYIINSIKFDVDHSEITSIQNYLAQFSGKTKVLFNTQTSELYTGLTYATLKYLRNQEYKFKLNK